MGYISHIDGSYYEGDMQYGDTVGVRPPLSLTQRKAVVQSQIDGLEAKYQLARPVREFLLSAAVKEASITINPITALPYTEPQLYAANQGYKAVKDFDAQITVLRLQMEAMV